MTQTLKSLGYRTAGVAVLAATAATNIGYKALAVSTCPDPTTDPLGAGSCASQPSGAAGNNNLFASGGIFHTIADTLIFIVAAVSVIMLIIGGLRYVLSSGEASAVKGAKDTILYAIVGIVVAILAFAAVSFVIGRFGTGTP